MICRNAAEAFAAGMAAMCDHGDDPVLCPSCRLTTEEIGSLAVLHRVVLTPGSAASPAPLAA